VFTESYRAEPLYILLIILINIHLSIKYLVFNYRFETRLTFLVLYNYVFSHLKESVTLQLTNYSFHYDLVVNLNNLVLYVLILIQYF